MTANPTFSPPPTAARDSVCVQSCRVSPPRSCGRAAHSGVSTRSRVLWGCHNLYPSIDVEADAYSEQDAQQPLIPKSSVVVWYRGHSPLPPRRSMVRRSLPPGCCVWSRACLGLSDSVQPHPPQTRLAHSGVSRLPLPVNTTQLIAVGLDNGPDPREHSGRFPPLESTMDGAVIAQTLRKAVPLAARAHPKDDCVEHLSRVLSSSPITASISSQRSSGTSQIVSSTSCLDIISSPPRLGSDYRLPEVLDTDQRFEIVT